MATTIFIDHTRDWVHSDIPRYACRAHIIELLENKWPSRFEGTTIIQNYQIQPIELAKASFRVWAPKALSKEDKQWLYDRYAALQRPRTGSWRLSTLSGAHSRDG